MKKVICRILGAVFFALFVSGSLVTAPARADIMAGFEAYKNGDFKEAIALWQDDAAPGGDARIQYLIGELYKEGRGVDLDAAEAIFWFKRAASGGDVEALMNLSIMHILGEGAESDLILGYMWAAAADSRDHDDGLVVMELLESKMGEQSAKTARILAARCIASEYTNCDYDS